MKINEIILNASVALMCLTGASAQAAGLAATCTFEECSAQLSQAELQVSCNGKTVYQGAYELSTDFKTTTIQPDGANQPQITLSQGRIPGMNESLKSTLTLPNKTIAGNCVLKSI